MRKDQPVKGRLSWWGYLLLAVVLIVLSELSKGVQAQWTTNGNNISNTNSGDVGVGTTTPNGGTVQIQSATPDNHLYLSSVAPDLVLGNNTTRASATAIGFVGLATAANHFGTGSAAGDLLVGVSQSNKLHWVTNGSIRATVDGSGNVGIGTTSPGLPLEVAKNQNAPTGMKVGNTTAGTGAFSYVQAAADTISGYLYTFSSSFSTNNLYVANGVTLESGTGGSGGLNLLANQASGVIRFGTGGNTERMRIDASGNVGIGTTNPQAALDVQGSINVSGNINAKFQDVAEWVPATHSLPAGTVVVLNPKQSNQVMASAQAYDTRVAGVVSGRPGIAPGEAATDKVLVATTGRVKVKVDATRAPIHVGDLLVTSDQEGVAMKSVPVNLGGVEIHRPGTLIGKALEPLEKGTGEILVLLSLQ